MPKIKFTEKEIAEAKELIKSITPIDGETRRVYKCGHCRKLFGRRFIPYSMGHGASFNLCMCQLTSNNVGSILVLEANP
jgi:hypothetical protein